MKRLLEENIELRYTTKEVFELEYVLTAAKMLSKLPNFPKNAKRSGLFMVLVTILFALKN